MITLGVIAILALTAFRIFGQTLAGKARQQAHLIAVACSKVPNGHDHWTVRMLANKAVELGFVEKISPETIRAVLKKQAQALATSAVVSPGEAEW